MVRGSVRESLHRPLVRSAKPVRGIRVDFIAEPIAQYADMLNLHFHQVARLESDDAAQLELVVQAIGGGGKGASASGPKMRSGLEK